MTPSSFSDHLHLVLCLVLKILHLELIDQQTDTQILIHHLMINTLRRFLN